MKVFLAEPGTWAGVLVSLLAAGIAIWQAIVAKQQAKLAEQSAIDSARQARAAEEQVTIMRAQLDGENADRAEARRPHFEVLASPMDYSDANQRYAEVVLTQTAGVALSRVTVRPSGEYVAGMRQSPYRDDLDMYVVGDQAEIDGMSKGSNSETLFLHFDYEHVTPARVELELQCTAREGYASWAEHLHLTVTDPA
ncbi:hypothetical protein AB0I75_32505 [Streptomyces sp. NPDC050273]|uniref:hypothetical protein n=1 Tax=Streptomyces sp. NPDC050273 TaxID=3154933 RepID=UPI00341F0ADD